MLLLSLRSGLVSDAVFFSVCVLTHGTESKMDGRLGMLIDVLDVF